MFTVSDAVAIIATSFTNLGVIMSACLGVLLTSLIALVGLGFATRKIQDTIFNMPGGYGYNAQYGSGWSRFRKTNYNGEGGHMKSIRF